MQKKIFIILTFCFIGFRIYTKILPRFSSDSSSFDSKEVAEGRDVNYERASILGADFHISKYKGSGTLVIYIAPRSVAEKSGLEIGDFVMAVNNIPVSSPTHLEDAYKKINTDRVKFGVIRGALKKNIDVQVGANSLYTVNAKTTGLRKPAALEIPIRAK